MALPAYPRSKSTLKELGPDFINQSMNNETANSIRGRFPQISWVGSGYNGVVNECKPGTACKFTRFKSEADFAQSLINNPHPKVNRIFSVEKVQENPDIWMIMSQKLRILNKNEKDIFSEFNKCLDENYQINQECINRAKNKLLYAFRENDINKMLASYMEFTKIYNDIHSEDLGATNVAWDAKNNLVAIDLDSIRS